ncbi:conserved exported hypothetical protein [Desulfamplus magnetovallimortis]|uniref:DUF362 domain-containing protein n=1 Tax=Desulfamplus magnetovallimortis TaxID=1246637 RepID=A0A1W1H728_9BACT|nr:DUF362 domain-containing protein [Desulfamplus magnetovallimortis]SLM28263.1 conserved exported hypothetical protein [Desulfamplus magnetovallimortis]
MDRRDFLKKAIGSGIAAGSTLAFTDFSEVGKLWAASKESKSAWDLVAVKGGEPDLMFDSAIASLGGMQNFVPKGSRVLVKPNIGWDVPPERAGNTHPKLVGRIVEHCITAGAKEVSVFDHTCDNWRQCYKNSGIEKAVKEAGGKIISGDSEGYYQKISVPMGKRLTETMVHEALLEADVFINVPVLKQHSSSMVTIGMKNLMGVVWDRRYWHRNDLHQCIADFASFRKPDLTVVDAYNVMKRNGPRGVSVNDVVAMKAQVVSTDFLAADSAAAKLFGLEPADIRHIKIASEMKLGQMNLKELSINRIKL